MIGLPPHPRQGSLSLTCSSTLRRSTRVCSTPISEMMPTVSPRPTSSLPLSSDSCSLRYDTSALASGSLILPAIHARATHDPHQSAAAERSSASPGVDARLRKFSVGPHAAACFCGGGGPQVTFLLAVADVDVDQRGLEPLRLRRQTPRLQPPVVELLVGEAPTFVSTTDGAKRGSATAQNGAAQVSLSRSI
jgi:hypothetical protein